MYYPKQKTMRIDGRLSRWLYFFIFATNLAFSYVFLPYNIWFADSIKWSHQRYVFFTLHLYPPYFSYHGYSSAVLWHYALTFHSRQYFKFSSLSIWSEHSIGHSPPVVYHLNWSATVNNGMHSDCWHYSNC